MFGQNYIQIHVTESILRGRFI